MGILDRIEYLEHIHRWYNRALDVLLELNNLFSGREKEWTQDTILTNSTETIRKLFRFEVLAFYLLEPDSAEFQFSCCYPDTETEFIQKKVEELIAANEFSWALNQNKSVVFPLNNRGRSIILHVMSVRKQPIGMFLGTMPAEYPEINDGSLRLLSLVLHNIAGALEDVAVLHKLASKNEELEKKIEENQQQLSHKLSHDSVTDLPNRLLFMDRVEQAIFRAGRQGHYVGLLVVDLDTFKMVNETLGHQLGDEVLREVSNRLKKTLRSSDSILFLEGSPSEITISRIANDEFSILLSDLKDLDDILLVVQRILQILSQPFLLSDHRLFITSSVGVSVYPGDGNQAQVILQNAEIAMQHAKKKAKNSYEFFSKEMNQSAFSYFKMGSDLHQAIEKQEFLLNYQPIMDLQTGKIVGLEALIRWCRDGKLIYPDSFIPLSEEMGLIVPIGEWVIQEACSMLKRLNHMGFRHLKMAMNLAAQQFRSEKLLLTLMQAMKQNDISAQYLELEITERTLMEDAGLTVSILEDLHAVGCLIAIDDFGIGYSSLNYLKKFQVDLIKIDKSFVFDLLNSKDDQAIVQAIIGLAHTLGLKLVAEGIETQEHAAFLAEAGCEYGQGYYFSRPMDEIALLKFTKEYATLFSAPP